MKIKKFGHSCLLLEKGLTKILIDPGHYSNGQNDERGISVILITHKHEDHLSGESISRILGNNPNTVIYCNSEVGEILNEKGAPFKALEQGRQIVVNGIVIEAFYSPHAFAYDSQPQLTNTGYFVDDFFYPGDSFAKPNKQPKILALPIAGPSWMKVSEAIDYAKLIRPKICIPVHDGMLKSYNAVYRWADEFLPAVGIKFLSLGENEMIDFSSL